MIRPLAHLSSDANQVHIIYDAATLVVKRVVIPATDHCARQPGGPCETMAGEAVVAIPAATYLAFNDPAQLFACVPGAPPYVAPAPFVQASVDQIDPDESP